MKGIPLPQSQPRARRLQRANRASNIVNKKKKQEESIVDISSLINPKLSLAYFYLLIKQR